VSAVQARRAAATMTMLGLAAPLAAGSRFFVRIRSEEREVVATLVRVP
jgi:hypothetical protein